MCIARSHLVALLHTTSKVDFQHIYRNSAVLVQAGWCCWNLLESLLYPLIFLGTEMPLENHVLVFWLRLLEKEIVWILTEHQGLFKDKQVSK